MIGEVIVFGLLLLAGALVVLPPLLGREAVAVPGRDADRQRVELEVRRDEVYAALREADLDLRTGKLDDADHAALRESLLAEATEILRRLDGVPGPGAEPAPAAPGSPGPPASGRGSDPPS